MVPEDEAQGGAARPRTRPPAPHLAPAHPSWNSALWRGLTVNQYTNEPTASHTLGAAAWKSTPRGALAIALMVLCVLALGCGEAAPECSACATMEAGLLNCDQSPPPPGCSDGEPTEEPPPPPPTSIAVPSFNGNFEDRAFPYTGSCSCIDTDGNPSTPSAISCSPALTNSACYCVNHDGNTSTPDVVQCSAPTDLSTGWTVTPLDTFRGTRGNGGVFFQYGAGRNPGPPRAPGYGVPDGTALYFQTCDDSDRWNNTIGPPGPPNYPTSPPDGIPDSDWCFQTLSLVVRSTNFAPTPGATYRLSAWLYSTTFMAVGSVFENRIEVRARFFNSSGTEIGGGTAVAPKTAPVSSWTEFSTMVTVPVGTSSAVVEVVEGRDHQSNVYVDDVALTAP